MMEVNCPHCNSKAQPEVIAVADLSCTICAACKAVLSTARSDWPVAEPLEEDAPLPPSEEPAPAFAPLAAQSDDVLSLPEEHEEAPPSRPDDYLLEGVFEAAPEPEPVAPAPPSVQAPDEAAAPFVSADAEQQPSQAPSAEEPDAPTVLPPAALPAPVPDGYAVGLRVMRIAPVWLLLSSVGFLSVLLLLSWASQPIPQAVAVAAEPAQAQKNEASNSAPRQQTPARPAERPAQPAQPEPAAPQPAPQAAPQPAPQAQPAPAQPKPSEGGRFAVQVGSYRDVSEANERVSVLRAAGYEAEAMAVEIPNRGIWHRVICGRAPTREEAVSLGAQLRARGTVREVIITDLSK